MSTSQGTLLNPSLLSKSAMGSLTVASTPRFYTDKKLYDISVLHFVDLARLSQHNVNLSVVEGWIALCEIQLSLKVL